MVKQGEVGRGVQGGPELISEQALLFIKSTYWGMLDRAISEPQATFSQDLSEEMEWIAGNDYFHDQLSRTLIEEVQAVCSSHAGIEQAEEQLLAVIHSFSLKMSARMKAIIHNCALELGEHRNKIKDYELELREKEDNVVTLNENIEALNGKIANWQTEYEALKSQLAEVQEKYERKLRQVKREKKEIKQTFRMVQESTEIERALLENLQIEKQQFQEQIMSELREKQVLQGELEEIKQKYLESAHKLQASASKLTWEEKRIKNLEEIVAEKDALILKLTQQILYSNRQDERSQDNKSQSIVITRSFVEEKHSNEEPKKHVSFAEIFNLSDEIMNMPQDFEMISLSLKKSQDHLGVNKSLSHISEGESDIPITFTEVPHVKQPPARMQIPDFYLAHFLLTSQAMKIKLNSEIYLGIDLSGHYAEVVRERVPFHMWDEWIRQKLRQLAGA